MDSILNIKGLTKHYDGFDLTDVNLAIPAGMVLGLVGSNGAGKTTIIRSLLGLTKIDKGTIDLFGERVFDAENPWDFDDVRFSQFKEYIGVVFDTCAFPGELRIKDINFMMRKAYHNWDNECFQTYLQEFNLPTSKKVKELSRGMGMKLSLACALSHGAHLLILDEATAGLDPLAREELLKLFQKFMRDENHAILMSSHITSDLEKIADYVTCIDNGRIIFNVEKDTIIDEAGIAQLRTAEFNRLIDDNFFAPDEMRYMKRDMGISVLVPNRFKFRQAYRDVAMERASIDDYMNLILKGEQR